MQDVLRPLMDRNSYAVTADVTLGRQQVADCLVHNTGATGTVVVTLPAGTAKMKARFLRTAAFTLTIDPNGTEIIKDAAGASLGAGVAKSLTTAGAYVELEHDGVAWNVIADRAADESTLLSATAGTVTASKAVIVSADKDAGDFRNLDCVNLDAGSSGVAGTVEVFPATGAKGKFKLACADQDADTLVTLQAAGMAQASVISLPDPGAATANVMLTSAANDQARVAATAAEIDVLAAVTAGTSAASKGLVLDANGDLVAGPVVLSDMTEGTGADGAANLEHSVVRAGGLFHTTIVVDLTNLNSGGTAGDIVGENPGVANCHLGQITAARNGTIFAGRMTCLEAPATGDVDIDLYAATEDTGAEDAAISGLTATQLCNSGNLSANTVVPLTAFPADTKYLYLVNNTPTDGTYSAGILLIELWGK